MQTEAQKLLNAVNSSTERWKRQGFQRRFSVTDLHGIEYQSVMTSNVPAQFYTSISYDFDKFAHWWFKIIVRPYGVKTGLKEGGSTISDYVHADGGEGNMQNFHQIYGKKVCPLGHDVENITIKGRSSHFCPICQKQ